jgi:hypothetical protein
MGPMFEFSGGVGFGAMAAANDFGAFRRFGVFAAPSKISSTR